MKKAQFTPPLGPSILTTVDGTTAYIPGQDFYEADEDAKDDGGEDADDFGGTPMSTSRTISTGASPVKKTRSPMVRIMK